MPELLKIQGSPPVKTNITVVNPDCSGNLKAEQPVRIQKQFKLPGENKYQGSLLGLACCDALGTTLEFSKPGTFQPVVDIVGGGPFNLEAGKWTDDTSRALCSSVSLIQCRGLNPIDQLEKCLWWYEEGYLSSTNDCFDIGITTISALARFQATYNPFCGLPSSSPSNGSLMCLSPVPLFYARDPKIAIDKSRDFSRLTHGAVQSIDACRYMAGLIIGALNGVSKEKLLSDHFCPVENLWHEDPLTKDIDEVASGSFKHAEPPEIYGGSHVAKSLEAALWAFYKSSSFKEGALLAVNLGNDADTTGAVYGQLAGAYYGKEGIPNEWLQKVYKRDLIELLAKELHKLAFHIS